MTTTRRPAPVENDSYLAFARRVIRSAGKRLAENPDSLGDLLALQAELDVAMANAVATARDSYGLSWADIGALVGTTRQAAQQRYGGKGATDAS
jgi:hypothetical protein